MAKTLWNRCRADFNRGFGGRFAKWLMAKKVMPPYIWGPIYRINGANIEKGCSDFKHWPYTSTSFEMKFAHKILEKDKNYMCADSDWRGGLYLPISDYTLPVYSLYEGKMHFDSEEEKIKFIEEHKADKNAN